jgi:serine/threonine protein kinase
MEERLGELGLANPIPPEAAALVMACLAKEPGQRPQSARAVAEGIRLEIETQPPAPNSPDLVESVPPQSQSRGFLASILFRVRAWLGRRFRGNRAARQAVPNTAKPPANEKEKEK